MADLDLILKEPELVSNLLARDWVHLFDRRILERAKSYTSPTRLLKLEVVRDGDALVAIAIFRGNHKPHYDTLVHFVPGLRDQWQLFSDCRCPVAYGCKHAAATLLAITAQLKKENADSGSLRGASDQEISAWLATVGKVAGTSQAHPPQDPQNATFLAYCLSPPESTWEKRFSLSLHVGRTLKNGELRINFRSNAKADAANPAKYMAPEDILPSTLHAQILRQAYHYGGARISGSQGSLLLSQALKTGRLYYVADESHPMTMVSGDEIKPEPIWETREDGSSAPVFAPPLDRPHQLIKTSPPFVLLARADSDEIVLHPLDTGRHSLDLLEAWQSGPTLRPEQVAKVATRFQKKTPSLPAPVPSQTKILKKSTPTRHLHLHRANPFSHGGHHLSGQPEPVIATLSFQYHGHAFRPDLAVEPPKKATFATSKKGTVYTISRDPALEREAILHLAQEHQFIPASAIDPEVSSDHGSAFLPHTSSPREWDTATAEFIATSVPQLEEAGWEVTIDPGARFEIHRIGQDDLETDLSEDPEHGIDWFQFSASYLTPSGEKESLLPLLSSFLQDLDFQTLNEGFEDLLQEVGEGHQTLLKDPDDPTAFLAFPTTRLLRLAKTLHDLFGTGSPAEPLHRLQAATLADVLEMDGSQTLKDLAALGGRLADLTELPRPRTPKALQGELRDYQLEGFHWMQFLARHSLHGILADDMGLGKTIQTLAHLQAEVSGRRTQKTPSLVIAPTSVVGNWQAEAKKFTPKLKTLLLQGPDRKEHFSRIASVHLVITSYALLVRDFERLKEQDFHLVILDEAQYIKNPVAKVSQRVCKLRARHRLSLSGTPLENHLGELWSQMRFLMPGLLGSSEAFRKKFRTPIEKHQDSSARLNLVSRVAPLILRRTKDAVATELPPKTEILHSIALHPAQIDIYETVRAAMDNRIQEAIADKGLAKSQIVVLDALLKLRQVCCHPRLLKIAEARKVPNSAKLDFLTDDLLPTLLEEGRRILIFSTFTTMLDLIQQHLEKEKISFSKITGSTTKRQEEVDRFQNGDNPVFLISLKAGGTGLNLTAADTVIHYDPWWNPAAENQATDRAYRIGQDKPVFVHKLISEGTIEERIVQLQAQKSKLVEALLSEKTSKLQLDKETLGNLLAPLE